MKIFFEGLLLKFLYVLFWFRYRVTIKGLEKLSPDYLKKEGGVLFLPNHSAVFVDPTLVTMAVWQKYPVRHLIVEYMYNAPVIHSVMKWLNAIPIPNNEVSSNPLKRKKAEKAFEEVIKGLKNKENFIIYPAGRLKASAQEVIGGASGVHHILEKAPETNVVLIRTIGLWGSSYSKAFTGVTPSMFSILGQGVKAALKNFIFFMPRREVIIEIEPAPADFPYQASRLELNRYLERWYNRPDHLSQRVNTKHAKLTTNEGKEFPGETLYLVSHSRWSEDYPEVNLKRVAPCPNVDLSKVSVDVQSKVKEKLAEMTQYSADSIKPEMHLSTDLGLDSLDGAELVVFLEDQFEVKGVPVLELTTVGRLMAIAAKQIVCKPLEEENVDTRKWLKKVEKKRVDIAPGKTIPEVFLNSCSRMGKAMACGDQRSGLMTYSDLKIRAILLANYIKKLPGEQIGILLPASSAATLAFFACQLAGKVPVMINWTVGSRHLESVVQSSKIKVVLSSWTFLDRLVNVDLSCIEDMLVMLEDVRREFTLIHKLKAFITSKRSTSHILKSFHLERNEESLATILFTSGTENLPKGVPLTHRNILSNQRGVLKVIEIFSDDTLFSILPPFHSFGLTVSSLLGLLAGIKIAYFPDPTDGKRVAQGIEHWKATIVCGAPTFLKNMLKAAAPGQLKSLRYVVSGAEKAPLELFHLLEAQGLKGILVEGYGITECSPVLTVNMGGPKGRGVGVPIPGVEICVIHPETHQLLGQGEQGLILARGPNIFSGYLNKTLASPFLTVNGKEWYITGDLGNIDETGQLTISGRLKRFIKIGPEMVSLASIEDALLEIAQKKEWPLVEEGASLAVCAKEVEGERPKIYLFTRFPLNLEDVNSALKDAGIGNLVKISSVKQLESIPLMGTGKVNYRELETQYVN